MGKDRLGKISRSDKNKSNSSYDERLRHRRLRSRSPSRRRGCTCEDGRSDKSDADSRLKYLESIVERLTSRESYGSDNNHHVVKVAVKSDCIPEFIPGKPNQSSLKWVDKIDQLAKVNKWDENTTIQLMQNRLTGLARTWYDNLTTYTYSWDEWKSLIVKTFPDHIDFAATLRQLVNREKRSNETMTQYYFGKMNLIQACNVTGKNAVSCLIDGLKDRTLQNGAKAGRYEAPEDLYTEYLSTLDNDETGTPLNERKEKDSFDRRRLGPRPTNSGTSKIFRKEPYHKSALRCYNCSQTGHISSKCTKPRKECGNCNLLGHETIECRRTKQKGPVVKLMSPKDTQQCYFIACTINGKRVKGYIDTGCSIVTIRETTAKQLLLEQIPTTQLISGYAGGATYALGETEVVLTVDLITAKVTASVVDDRVQLVPIIIGQTFLNRAGVTLVLRDNHIRLFENHLAVLPELDNFPTRKVDLRAKEDVVIPPYTVGFVEVCSEDTYDREVYVEATTRSQPNFEYSIPGCITAVGGVISIRNAANHSLEFQQGRLLVRGFPCKQEEPTNEVNVHEDVDKRSVAEL